MCNVKILDLSVSLVDGALFLSGYLERVVATLKWPVSYLLFFYYKEIPVADRGPNAVSVNRLKGYWSII